ncbi:hypothetical protein [Trichlorobacter sp.]|uniref:hypothetical protein n=1 Tax=Trichlorobacter sp. TaxID=2911007 RepID=UPI002A35DFA2|nr:hypothetical protein [Trichlorobacter sp.]MDY0384051.1 hypothetical protein [Trichlorobacter sp.]
MRKFLLLSAVALLPACANMEVAKYSLQDDAVKPNFRTAESVEYTIDNEYLESKFVTNFSVSHDEAGLAEERKRLVAVINNKLKNSLPDTFKYVSDISKSTTKHKVVFQPVVRIAVLEREQVATSNASFKARIYSQGSYREITLKGEASSNISCSGGFAYIGTMEYYKNFMWNEELVNCRNNSINESVSNAIQNLTDKLNYLK